MSPESNTPIRSDMYERIPPTDNHDIDDYNDNSPGSQANGTNVKGKTSLLPLLRMENQ
jgi:hypothetical protein